MTIAASWDRNLISRKDFFKALGSPRNCSFHTQPVPEALMCLPKSLRPPWCVIVALAEDHLPSAPHRRDGKVHQPLRAPFPSLALMAFLLHWQNPSIYSRVSPFCELRIPQEPAAHNLCPFYGSSSGVANFSPVNLLCLAPGVWCTGQASPVKSHRPHATVCPGRAAPLSHLFPGPQ